MLRFSVLVLLFVCSISPGICGIVDPAFDFNVFAFGNLSSSSDIGSRVAVGGQLLSDLTLGNHPFNTYSFPDFLVLANGVNGHNVTQNTGGNVYANGYNSSGPGHIQIQNGSGTITTSGPDPINFANEYATLTSLSQAIALQAVTSGSTTNQTTNIILTATGSNTTDYFNITAAQFANLAGIVTNGNTVIINVSGTSANSSNTTLSVDGQQPTGDSTVAQNVLFNFYQATGIIDLNATFGGAILAPNATLIGNSEYDGTAIVNNLNFQGEIHGAPFTGNITVVAALPEPATWSTLGAGSLLLGAAAILRRKRRSGGPELQ